MIFSISIALVGWFLIHNQLGWSKVGIIVTAIGVLLAGLFGEDQIMKPLTRRIRGDESGSDKAYRR
jgi:hypothetical protein